MSKRSLYKMTSDISLWNVRSSVPVSNRLRVLIRAFGTDDEGRVCLAANEVDSVYFCEPPQEEGVKVLSDMEFYDALPKGTDTIYGNVCDSVAALIQDEYGIH